MVPTQVTADSTLRPARSPQEEAALLEQAIRAGSKDPEAAYLLAVAYKRQGKVKEAREALRRISTPDANVYLQLGLLSLREGQMGQAAQEFARALELEPTFAEACWNLLFARLSLAQIDSAFALLPRCIELAADPGEQRLLRILQALLGRCQPTNGDTRADDELLEMSDDEEERILRWLRGIGHLETVGRLTKALAAARPESSAARTAWVETTLLRAKELLDRCQWLAAKSLLESICHDEARLASVPKSVQAAAWNLLGCCAVLCQDFDDGIGYFSAALRSADSDPRIHQNLALAYEYAGDLARAEPHWNRYFDLLDRRVPAAPEQADSVIRLAFEGLNRLGSRYSEREQFAKALTFLERAQRLQPDNAEVLERLFHLYTQTRRPDSARRVLRQLKELRPHEPQLDLYEVDVGEPRGVDDIERMIGGISRVRDQHAGDARVEERAAAMIGSAVSHLHRFSEEANGQLNKLIDRVHHLPNDEINWRSVRGIARDLRREFQQLRRTASKCLPLVANADQRRALRDLTERLERKIDQCRRWEED